MKHKILHTPYFLHTFALGNKCNNYDLRGIKTFND